MSTDEQSLNQIDGSAAQATDKPAERKKRKSGITTGNAGEYLAKGEILRRGYEAQLADRNTRGYDLLAGRSDQPLQRVQVKTVRAPPWYVRRSDFQERPDQVTIYVLLGPEQSNSPARFFVTINKELADQFEVPAGWIASNTDTGFMKLGALKDHEDRWKKLVERQASAETAK